MVLASVECENQSKTKGVNDYRYAIQFKKVSTSTHAEILAIPGSVQ